jgi:aminotransferase
VLALGGVPVRVPLYEMHGFRLQPDDLAKVLSCRTKALILTYPSNPLGAILTREAGTALAKVIQEKNIFVISDEVYEKIVFDGKSHFSLGQLESICAQVLIVGSLSKTYAMTGWRVGYVLCPDAELMCHMAKMQQAVVSCLPPFIMQAAADAINGPQDCVEEMRRHYQRRRDLLLNGLDQIPGMKCFRTEGSFCTFVNISGFGVSSQDFAEDLLLSAGVLTVAGSAFGRNGEGYLRVCFANSDEHIIEGVSRIKNYLAALRKR